MADEPTLANGPPSELRIDVLNTATPNLADELILWPMDPTSVIEHRCLEYCCTPNLSDEHTLANGPPGQSRIDALNTATPNLADKPTLANGPPSKLRIETLNTATPNLADKPTLADGSPSTVI